MKKILLIGLVSFSIILVSGLATAGTTFHGVYNVSNGIVNQFIDNTDANASFHGSGQFTGDVWSNDHGNYLDTDVDVSSSSGAMLQFNAWQNLAGYTNNRVETSSYAMGSTAGMNIRFDNSMYVVQLERHDTGKDLLTASGSAFGIGYLMAIADKTTFIQSAFVKAEVYDDPLLDGGSATIDTNQWHPTATGSYGWGSPDSIVSPSDPGYYTPTNTVSATGSGMFNLEGYGANSVFMNGLSFGGGSHISMSGPFFGGMSGPFQIKAS